MICEIDADLFSIPVIEYTSFSHQARMRKMIYYSLISYFSVYHLSL